MEYFFIFGILVELIILQTAKADIPGCHFLETVNITSSQRLQTGSYMYQDIEIPEYLTGQYDYIMTEIFDTEIMESHLRGCVCQLKPCIWICCRFKDWDESNGKCTDSLMEELAGINPFLKVTLINGSVVKRNLLKDFLVLRDRTRLFDFWGKDKYTLFENGSVLFYSADTVNFRGYDCLHPNQFTSGNTESFLAAFHRSSYLKEPPSMMPGYKELMCLSEVFLVLSIAVYFYVGKLRNLHGKCFICYMIASFMHFFFQLLEAVPFPLQLCALQGYVMIYFFIAKFSWLLALSHQLWIGFTSVSRVESEYSFGAYSILAWGSAAILTGIFFLVDQIRDGDLCKVDWVSGIGWDNCDFNGMDFGSGYLFCYIILTPVIVITFNTILIILTTISIIRVKLSLRHFFDQDERARNLNSRMQTFRMFASLLITMDIQWSLRVTSIVANWKYLKTICLYCDSGIGIIIFVLFVLKRSTLKLLMER